MDYFLCQKISVVRKIHLNSVLIHISTGSLHKKIKLCIWAIIYIGCISNVHRPYLQKSMKLSACAKICYIELMQGSIHSFNRSIASTQHRLWRSLFVHAFHVRQEPYKHTHKRLFTVSCPPDLHSPGKWGAPHQHKETKQVREHKHKTRRPNICRTCQVTSSYKVSYQTVE